MKRPFVIGVSLLGFAAPAVAADIPVKAPIRAPVTAPAYNWSGFYIGGFVGGAFGDRNATSTQPCSVAAPAVCYNTPLATSVVNSYDLDSSIIGGGTIGYNWQPAGSQWLLGLEAEVGYIRLNRSVVDGNAIAAFGPASTNGIDTTRIGDWYAVLAARAGFTVDRVLVYGKGGVAFVDKHYDYTDVCTAAPACGPLTLTMGRSDTRVTWAAGGGIEWAFASNWSLKGEYLYLATRETITVTGTTGPAPGTPVSNTHTDPGVHTAKLGLNYKFDWGGPVVARY